VYRKTFVFVLLTFSLVFTPFASLADEGMWLPHQLDKLPFDQLKKRGLQLKPEEIYSTKQTSLKDAAVIIGGGTGTFVSPDGLIITNHHVAFDAVTAASTTENNYIEDGFLAKARAEEIPAKDYQVSITQDIRDVTAEVLSAVKPEMSDAERSRALAAKQREVGNAASKDGLAGQVVEAYHGAQYHLYVYQRIRDVRLVYAPPKSIGYFGGDPDNFEWPRHCGDFAFLRAYVAPNGNAQAFSKDNVPFKPKKFLALDASGLKEGDFTMILGYPGTTARWRESYSVEYNQLTRLPFVVDTLTEQMNYLIAQGENDPAAKIKNADTIFGLSNTIKNYEGTIKGLKRSQHAAKKRAEEAEFTKWLDGNPAAKAKYGHLLPGIAKLYEMQNAVGPKEQALSGVLGTGILVQALSFAYSRALDKDKPQNERNPRLSDAALPTIQNSIKNLWAERDAAFEQERLQRALQRADALTGTARSAALDALFTGKTGAERRQAEAAFARAAIAETPFKTPDDLTKLFNAQVSEFRAHPNALVKLVAAITDESAGFAKQTEAFNTAIPKLRADYANGLMEWKKGPFYPDANRTLRFTFGDVRGYKPRDAVTYDWQTSLTGVIEKDTGLEPFNVPAKLKDLAVKKDYGNYTDARLRDVPVAFLTTNDITGGNSGSSVLNARGDVIGLAFDGNYEGLGGDYTFDAALNRCLVVDIRYVLFITEKFAGADYLFKEMTIKRGKAMAAGR
jgi:hypothetical protein